MWNPWGHNHSGVSVILQTFLIGNPPGSHREDQGEHGKGSPLVLYGRQKTVTAESSQTLSPQWNKNFNPQRYIRSE